MSEVPVLVFDVVCFRIKVLVENGTKEGHQILMEARETLLKVLPVDEKRDGKITSFLL